MVCKQSLVSTEAISIVLYFRSSRDEKDSQEIIIQVTSRCGRMNVMQMPSLEKNLLFHVTMTDVQVF